MRRDVEEIDIQRWRRQFPILERCVYLISNSLGAMPRSVLESLQEYAEVWSSRGVRAWEESWWDMPVRVGDAVARLIGASPGEVTMHPNVTIAQWIVLSMLRPTASRRRIVYTSLNFPSIRYFYQAQPELEVRIVPSRDGMTVELEEFLEAIDEQTLAVPMSHVLYNSSYIQQVEAVTAHAHRQGARVILDTYQSCGTLPFDVKELQVDFVVGGSVKWLCGGPGAAYLYVRPDLKDRLEPRLTGWMAHQDPFAFEEEMRFSSSAFRFLNGTPVIPALYAARCGYGIIEEVGVDKIRRRSLQLTERILQRADEYGFEVHTPRHPQQRGGAVTLRPPQPEQAAKELLRRGFLVDYRPGSGIRLGPHFYNTMDEIDAALREMHRIAVSG